ncbi:hypothetical protein ACVGWX_07935, partial [Enterobacter hormaechei]
AGPVDYVLGKDRQTERATLHPGTPEQAPDQIDDSHNLKKNTTPDHTHSHIQNSDHTRQT